jgi:hypothetical protein
MAQIPITLTCADYARLAPLVTGDVKPEGVYLTVIHGTGGSWPARAEMLRRALHDPAVQGGEASMAAQLRRIDKADRKPCRPAGLSAAQFHGARPLCPQGRPDPRARRPDREAHRHV